MKKTQLALSLFLSLSIFAQNKAIYGEDNRRNYHELTDGREMIWASATAAMIPSHIIFDDEGDIARIKSKMLSQFGICEYEKFAREIAAAECTGFLVAPDILVTAGHCMQVQNDCDAFRWVFDYKTGHDYQIGRTLRVGVDKVFRCDHIIATKLSNETDFAIIKLDRPVTDRPFLQIRRSGEVVKDTAVTLVGYPSGIPVKVAAGAKVIGPSISENLFLTNTDSFVGNSGSPVINSLTGEVEGILVSGEEDYEMRKRGPRGCMVPKVCTDQSNCKGEEVTKISEILNYL